MVLLFVAILIATAGLIAAAWFEVSSGILQADAQIFQTVGRGILNGLTPYSDLFETKPPGVFLLYALSLTLFDSQLLAKIVQAIVIIGIPIAVVVPSIALMQDRSAAHRKVISVLSILFGLILALYTANQAGTGLTESYGAFFAITALAVIVSGKWKVESGKCWKQIILISVMILFSIGFKEPFVLTILAGVLFLKKDVLPSFVYPLCVTVFVGMIALLLLGFAAPYFQIYLPHMLGYHVQQHDGIVFIRALQVWRLFINIGVYSPMFTVTIFGLWVFAFFQSRATIVRFVCASYLTFLSVAVGGDFYGHHFIFAVPAYAALWWIFVQHFPKRLDHNIVLGCIITLSVAGIVDTQLSYAAPRTLWKETDATMKRVATVIDTTMDRCGWEKYLQMIVREGGPYAYTKHSPFGPIFVHYARFIGANPLYQKGHIQGLKDANIILISDIENSNLTDVAKEYLNVRYAKDPPACAGEDFEQPLPYHLLFRQSF